MKKGKKNLIFLVALLSMPCTQHANTLQQHALTVVGAALAVGGVHLLVRKVSGQKKPAPLYIQDIPSENSLVRTRRRSFTRSSVCKDDGTSPDFYQESKRILTRTLGIASIAAGMYLILNGSEFLEKMNRAQRAYTWMGYWQNLKDYVGSWFVPAPQTPVTH